MLVGNLDVHAHPVGVESGLVDKFLAGSGDAFQVDIPVETVYLPEVFHYFHEAFHGVVGIAHDTGTEEKSLDVIPTVEFDDQVD